MSYPIPPDLIQRALDSLKKTAFVPGQGGDPMAAGGMPPMPGGMPPMPGGMPPMPGGGPMDISMLGMPPMPGGDMGAPSGMGLGGAAGPNLASLFGDQSPPSQANQGEEGNKSQEVKEENQTGSKTIGSMSEEDFRSVLRSSLSDAIDNSVSDLVSAVRELREQLADIKDMLNQQVLSPDRRNQL